ncbi:hypothetical protein Adt_12444 [Abeliophyllum distichum]|uniref:Uncharacterized protein n=1 Tax=Abeliophyllum distichum TaxID=126358 RepID=A0ABD1US82_9LAMI
MLQSYFDLLDNWSPEENWAICAAIDSLAANRYWNYKLKYYLFYFFLTKQHKFVEVGETQQAYVVSSGASVDEHTIAREVLGECQRNVCGVRRAPKERSPSLKSTYASNAS